MVLLGMGNRTRNLSISYTDRGISPFYTHITEVVITMAQHKQKQLVIPQHATVPTIVRYKDHGQVKYVQAIAGKQLVGTSLPWAAQVFNTLGSADNIADMLRGYKEHVALVKV